jgi:hypothetical protein
VLLSSSTFRDRKNGQTLFQMRKHLGLPNVPLNLMKIETEKLKFDSPLPLPKMRAGGVILTGGFYGKSD